MNPGVIFSLCAGILIGLKLYYRYFVKNPKREETSFTESRNEMKNLSSKLNLIIQLPYALKRQEAEKLKKEETAFTESRNEMDEIINREQYCVLRPRKGERIVDLGNGKYIVVTDRSSSRFWHDLWYGSGWKSGKNS